jgi:hypothetical protein
MESRKSVTGLAGFLTLIWFCAPVRGDDSGVNNGLPTLDQAPARPEAEDSLRDFDSLDRQSFIPTDLLPEANATNGVSDRGQGTVYVISPNRSIPRDVCAAEGSPGVEEIDEPAADNAAAAGDNDIPSGELADGSLIGLNPIPTMIGLAACLVATGVLAWKVRPKEEFEFVLDWQDDPEAAAFRERAMLAMQKAKAMAKSSKGKIRSIRNAD